MLYYFLLYNEVNQLYVCLYPLRPGPPSHAPHPTHLGRHRAPTELSFLCFIARSHSLSILRMVVYICQS